MNPFCIPETTLQFFQDRELTPEEASAVQNHLDLCAACRSRLESIAASDLWLTRLFQAEAEEQLAAAPIPLHSPVKYQTRSGFLLMFALSFGVYLGFWLWQAVLAAPGGASIAWISGSAGNIAVTRLITSLSGLIVSMINHLAVRPGLLNSLTDYAALWCLTVSAVMLVMMYLGWRPRGTARTIH
ncbi:MAG: zf-HC2 domain-containing protein [Solirubrobacterales bacterium]